MNEPFNKKGENQLEKAFYVQKLTGTYHKFGIYDHNSRDCTKEKKLYIRQEIWKYYWQMFSQE